MESPFALRVRALSGPSLASINAGRRRHPRFQRKNFPKPKQPTTTLARFIQSFSRSPNNSTDSLAQQLAGRPLACQLWLLLFGVEHAVDGLHATLHVIVHMTMKHPRPRHVWNHVGGNKLRRANGG